jgi:hypothetical protein
MTQVCEARSEAGAGEVAASGEWSPRACPEGIKGYGLHFFILGTAQQEGVDTAARHQESVIADDARRPPKYVNQF